MAHILVIKLSRPISQGDYMPHCGKGYKMYIYPAAVYKRIPDGDQEIVISPEDRFYLLANRYREVYNLGVLRHGDEIDDEYSVTGEDEELNQAIIN